MIMCKIVIYKYVQGVLLAVSNFIFSFVFGKTLSV